MGTTANRGYPYPDPTDPADMAGGLQALAEAVDLDVQALVGTITPVPLCVVSKESQTTGFLSGFEQNLGFDTVNYDNDNMSNLSVDNVRLTPPTPGLYFLHAGVRCPDVTSKLELFVRVNSTDFGRAVHQGNPPGGPRLTVSALANLNGTDTVKASFIQNTGGSTTFFSSRLTVLRVA